MKTYVKNIPEEAYTLESVEEIKLCISDANKGGIRKLENIENGKVIYFDKGDGMLTEVEGALKDNTVRSIIVTLDDGTEITVAKASIIAIARSG